MIRKVLMLMTIATFASAQSVGLSPNLNVAQVVARVRAVNAATTTFSADFTQEYLAKAYGTTKRSTGHVVFAAGGQADFSYTDPPGVRVVSNGAVECTYIPDVNQLFMQPAGASQYPTGSVLVGNQLTQNFFFNLVSSAAVGQANGYVLTGTPSSTMPTVAKLLLYVDAQTFETRRVLLIDGRQDHNRFDFTNIQRNVPVKAGQFVIYPPAGTTVFNMAGTPTNMPVSCP